MRCTRFQSVPRHPWLNKNVPSKTTCKNTSHVKLELEPQTSSQMTTFEVGKNIYLFNRLGKTKKTHVQNLHVPDPGPYGDHTPRSRSTQRSHTKYYYCFWAANMLWNLYSQGKGNMPKPTSQHPSLHPGLSMGVIGGTWGCNGVPWLRTWVKGAPVT